MCYRLYLASPLTLSEIRSMLPLGVAADLLTPSLQRFFAEKFHPARTAVLLRRGGCSCDLAGRRHPDATAGERELRSLYRREGASRATVITALERHRAEPWRGPPVVPGHWSTAMAEFAAEHARNAGPSLYLLDCSAEPERMPPWSAEPTPSRGATEVRARPAAWLPESGAVIVVP